MGASETVTCALQALPRASGPKAWMRVACLPSWMEAALPMIIPQRITPWPPRPPTRICVLLVMGGCPRSILAIAARPGPVLLAEVARVVRVHGVEPGRPLPVDELPHRDLPLEAERDLAGARPVLLDALLLVVLELVDAVP